jgi:hypothetical protein
MLRRKDGRFDVTDDFEHIAEAAEHIVRLIGRGNDTREWLAVLRHQNGLTAGSDFFHEPKATGLELANGI